MFNKIRFYGAYGATAGLVMETEKLRGMTLAEVSELFPVFEACNMKRFQVSPDFNSWDEAFLHSFE